MASLYLSPPPILSRRTTPLASARPGAPVVLLFFLSLLSFILFSYLSLVSPRIEAGLCPHVRADSRNFNMDLTGPGPGPGSDSTMSASDSGDAAAYNEGGTRLVASIWMLSAVALFFLIFRCYCKHLIHRGLWWDDWVLIVSWVWASFFLSFFSLRMCVYLGDPGAC